MRKVYLMLVLLLIGFAMAGDDKKDPAAKDDKKDGKDGKDAKDAKGDKKAAAKDDTKDGKDGKDATKDDKKDAKGDKTKTAPAKKDDKTKGAAAKADTTCGTYTFTSYKDDTCKKAADKAQVMPTTFVPGKCYKLAKASAGVGSVEAKCSTVNKVTTLTFTSYSDAACATAVTTGDYKTPVAIAEGKCGKNVVV